MTQENEREDVSFEAALARLEQIVRDLEAGELPLETAIENFQEGMKLAKICRDKLEQAEQKIEMLVKENGEFLKKPFQPEDER
jgi:exodeoxyribonuclease VII small subunit